MALVPGSSAGPYRIIEPLGRGGMASVYKAYEAALDRYVALKVLPREFLHDPGFAKRFEREARAIAKLEHPNIVPIYAYAIDEEEGIPWMAMRLIGQSAAGGALSQLIRRGRLPFPRAVAILRGVADALDYAHGKGIVHRDVKPPNVLLDDDGRVYLADFGIAKMVESSGGLTATGMISGTPQYMAPEQATGKNVGPPADVYALGIVAYEMFTGVKPFDADTPVAIMIKHLQESLPIPAASTLPEPLLRPVLKCTAKRAEDRWPSAGAFVHALEEALGSPTAAIESLPTLAQRPSPAVTARVNTAVSPPTAPVPGPTILTRPHTVPPAPTATPAPRPEAPPRLPEQRPQPQPPRPPRAGASPALLAAGAAAFVLVLGAAAAVLWLRSRPASSTDTVVAQGGSAGAPTPPSAALSPPVAPPVAAAPVAAPQAAAAATAVPETARTGTPRPATPQPPNRPTPTPPTPTPRPPTPQPPTTLAAAAPAPASAVAPRPAPAPTVDPEIAQLSAALGQGDAASRWRAAQALGSYRAEAAPAVPALTGALGDRSAEVRWRAAEALGLIGAPAAAAVPAMTRALSDGDPLVRTEATKALGLLGAAASAAVPQLAQGLASPDVSIRRESARALGRVGPPAAPAVGALVARLSDKDKFVRMESARALGRIGPAAREATPALAAAARDAELLVSREAQAALKAIGN